MDAPNPPPAAPIRFRQPKPWLRWSAVALAALGWYVSLQLLLISGGRRTADPLVAAACGDAEHGGCASVLAAPNAYIPFGREAGALRLPVAALGMAYFAAVGLWYLLIGPPTHPRRAWHLLIGALVLVGAWQSLAYIGIMALELRRWCGGCLLAHALNGGLLVLTLLAWPWRRPAAPTWPHPGGRLVLATAIAAGLAGLVHLALVYVNVAGNVLRQRTAEYAAVLNDPEFVLWDHRRQAPAALPLAADEVFAGPPGAASTVVVFGDFHCTACRKAEEVLADVLARHPGAVRIAHRHCPQDPACNPDPKYRAGGHPGACQAARAAEAARIVGGAAAYLRYRDLLFERQALLPARPEARQSAAERSRLADWAAEIGLDRTAFERAMGSDAAAARVQADVQLARELGLSAMPVIYLDGRRLRNWSRSETWDVLLGAAAAPAAQPATAPG